MHNGFNTDLDAINIYKCVKTMDNKNEPATQALLTSLRGCTNIRLVNDMGTFIPSGAIMEATSPAARTWGFNKFNTTFPNLFTLHQYPAPAAATDSPDININLFQHFLSALKLPGLSPSPDIYT